MKEGLLICKTCNEILTIVHNKEDSIHWYIETNYQRHRPRSRTFNHCQVTHGKPMMAKEYKLYDLQKQKFIRYNRRNSHLS